MDAVDAIAQLATADIEESPSFGARVSPKPILGMAKIKGDVKALLDIDKVIGGDTVASLAANPALAR